MLLSNFWIYTPYAPAVQGKSRLVISHVNVKYTKTSCCLCCRSSSSDGKSGQLSSETRTQYVRICPKLPVWFFAISGMIQRVWLWSASVDTFKSRYLGCLWGMCTPRPLWFISLRVSGIPSNLVRLTLTKSRGYRFVPLFLRTNIAR